MVAASSNMTWSLVSGIMAIILPLSKGNKASGGGVGCWGEVCSWSKLNSWISPMSATTVPFGKVKRDIAVNGKLKRVRR